MSLLGSVVNKVFGCPGAQKGNTPVTCHDSDSDETWTGYSAPTPTPDEAAHMFDYELSAYSDKVGYYADGIQRVCPLPRRK